MTKCRNDEKVLLRVCIRIIAITKIAIPPNNSCLSGECLQQQNCFYAFVGLSNQ